MDCLLLATTGRKTTRLGFGCAFAPSTTSTEASALLDAAYDAGIRHFDVAPLYGDGIFEGYLGKFLKTRSGEATVTTKYGILPPSVRPLHYRVARMFAGPVVRRLRQLPSVDRLVSRAVSALRVSGKAEFSATQAMISLHRSLLQLQCPRVDVFLMHEPTVNDLADEDLLRCLEDNVAQGRIGVFGVGGVSSRMPKLYSERRRFCRVMQFDCSVFGPKNEYPDSFRIHYGALSRHVPALHSVFIDRPHVRRRWSEYVGYDVGNTQMLAALMLKAALVLWPSSVVLFSSQKRANIVRNVRVAEDSALSMGAVRFCELVDKEGSTLVAEVGDRK